MFGKTPRVSALELRKQLLLAESELNRAQLSDEWGKMKAEIFDLTYRAKTIAVWSSSAAMLMAGLAAFRNRSGTGAERETIVASKNPEMDPVRQHILAGIPQES